MDFHIITPRGAELVMRVVDGVLEVPPAPENCSANASDALDLQGVKLANIR